MFRTGIQLLLPDDYLVNREWGRTLSLISSLNIDHLELNVTDPLAVDPVKLTLFLQRRNLEIKKLATGYTAKLEKLCLSSPDISIRNRTLKRCRDFISLARELKCDVIFGSIKGMVDLPKPESDKNLFDSLKRLEEEILSRRIRVYVEAINRNETTSVNTVDEGFELIKSLSVKGFTVLPDTYHMNTEESDLPATLRRNVSSIDTIHISDNNRFYPGLGNFNFKEFIRLLKSIDFIGTLTIEGNIESSFEQDIRKSMTYLTGIM